MPLNAQSAKRTTTLLPLVPQACKRVAPASYLAAVLADTPAGYWKLDETSGAVMSDSSGNARDGTYNGAPTLNQSPLITVGKSVAYTGGNFSRIPTNAGFNANGKVTLEAWLKTASVAGGELICSDDSSGSRYCRMEVTGAGKLQALIFDNGGSVHTYTVSATINDNVRHHCVVTYDGATILAYVDGTQDGAGTAAVFTLATTNSGIQLAERFSSGADSSILTGTLDECAIYTQALSAARIASHYASGIT